MFTTLRKEFASIFNDFINCGKEFNKKREERVFKALTKHIEVLTKYHDELEELKTFKSDVSKLIYT